MLVVAAALASHLDGMTSVNDPNQPDTAWWTVLLVLCGTVPVYWRRTHTLIVGLVLVTAETVGCSSGSPVRRFSGR